MSRDKKELYEAINKNLNQIRKSIDQHHCLLASLLGFDDDSDHLEIISKHCPYLAREERLKKAIQEAVETLEQTKKSFKSKRLEMLRKKLTNVLIEAEQYDF